MVALAEVVSVLEMTAKVLGTWYVASELAESFQLESRSEAVRIPRLSLVYDNSTASVII